MSALRQSLQQLVRQADRALLPIVSRSYELHRLHSRLHLARSFRRQPLLVHQMGKVGSSTVVASLEASQAVTQRYSVYHVHFMTPERLRHEEELYRSALRKLKGARARRRLHPHYVWTGQFLAERLGSDERRWTLVTLVREPIARRLSSFFQNLETLLGYDYRSKLQTLGHERVLEELGRLLLERYLDEPAGQEIETEPDVWFDRELRDVFGVDVYHSGFSPEKGYQLYESPRARVLLVRMEDLDRALGPGLEELLGVEVRLVRANVAESKDYADLYERFAESVALPGEYVERTYASRYCRHFYSPQEIELFRRKWSRGRAPALQPSTAPSDG